jgi:hypothetical protein
LKPNKSWTKLLKELNLDGTVNNNTSHLRTKWVFGASELLAGKNGSKVNYKDSLGYTDDEWNFIWTAMLEDGAWSVPSVTDSNGKVVKENFAPEMFIKYIAHDLRCHIIVFDLKLDRVQFCSANNLKDENLAFDSPLLLYATGSHFQSVLPQNHSFFEVYAKQLEMENSADHIKDGHGMILKVTNNMIYTDPDLTAYNLD